MQASQRAQPTTTSPHLLSKFLNYSREFNKQSTPIPSKLTPIPPSAKFQPSRTTPAQGQKTLKHLPLDGPS